MNNNTYIKKPIIFDFLFKKKYEKWLEKTLESM